MSPCIVPVLERMATTLQRTAQHKFSAFFVVVPYFVFRETTIPIELL
jgi:hypothetical protein